jgi:hypothetical protein
MVTGASTPVKSVTVESITVKLVDMFKQIEIRQRVFILGISRKMVLMCFSSAEV